MFTDIFLPEVLGTATLLLLGCGVVANAVLPKTNGFGGGFLMINFGWGIAVFSGVYVAVKSGAHLNPAVTLGLWASGVDLSAAEILVYISAQIVGAFLGAVLAWAAYKKHFDDPEADEGSKPGCSPPVPESPHPCGTRSPRSSAPSCWST